MFHVKHDRSEPEDRAHVYVYGTVQGVGFRYFVRQAARSRDLAGYVLNRPDGSVEIEAGGSPDRVRELLHTVENGPPGARVERVENAQPTEEALPLPFAIRH